MTLPHLLLESEVQAHLDAVALALSSERVEATAARVHRITTAIRELRLELEEAERAHAEALDAWGRLRDRIPPKEVR